MSTFYDCLGPQFGLHLTVSFMAVIIFLSAFYGIFKKHIKYNGSIHLQLIVIIKRNSWIVMINNTQLSRDPQDWSSRKMIGKFAKVKINSYYEYTCCMFL